jgi:hypothetical protein
MKTTVTLIALFLLSLAVIPPKAEAYNCTTTCSNFGNQRVCNTSCY